MGDFFQQFLNKARAKYKEADKATGGWLPGGGIASPLTRSIFPPQVAPGRSKELEKITGVKARIIDPNKNPSLVSKIAPVLSSWGTADYANPLLNEIGIYNYKGTGVNPREKQLEIHELGHINPADKSYYSLAGVMGRFLTGVSEKLGNPGPLEVAGGLALQYFDAPEEDRAERFAKKYAQQLNYPSPNIDSKGRSEYGNILRKQGKETIQRSLDPFELFPKAQQGLKTLVRDVTSQGLVNQYEQQMKSLRQQYIIPGLDQDKSGNMNPNFLKALKEQDKVGDELTKRGYDVVELINRTVEKEKN
jgi:hypothetical protein